MAAVALRHRRAGLSPGWQNGRVIRFDLPSSPESWQIGDNFLSKVCAMTLNAFFRPLALAATLALAPAVAAAFTVTYQSSGNVFGSNASTPVTINSVAGPDVGPLAVRAGGFALNGNLFGNGAENFTAFCLDIATTIKSGKNYEVTPAPFTDDPLTTTQIGNIRRLFNTAYTTLNLSDGAQSAGFQLALWEIIYETDAGFVLGTGNFSATNYNSSSAAAITAGQGFLAGLAAWDGIYRWNLTFLESKPHLSQNLVTATPVPLPAAGVLLLAALGGLGAMRRRRR
jgi:hypothetical protein